MYFDIPIKCTAGSELTKISSRIPNEQKAVEKNQGNWGWEISWRKIIQKFSWFSVISPLKVMQTGVEIIVTEDQSLVVFFQTGIQWGSRKEAADSGSFLLRSRILVFGCNSSRSNLLQIPIVWNGLSADAGNVHCWRQPELHRTSCQSCDAQTIEEHRHEITFHTRKSWWQLSSTGLHVNWSTCSKSVDEVTSTSKHGAASKAIIVSIPDYSSA